MKRWFVWIASAFLLGCQEDLARCQQYGRPYFVGGECRTDIEAMVYVGSMIAAGALAIWLIRLFVGMRRDISRMADALERLDRNE